MIADHSEAKGPALGSSKRSRNRVKAGRSVACPHQGIVEIEQERRVFLNDRFRHSFGHLHDGLKLAGLPESTLSEVLLGRRRLNSQHIGILARDFRIDPGVFLAGPAG
jgi:hypothetical protein